MKSHRTIGYQAFALCVLLIALAPPASAQDSPDSTAEISMTILVRSLLYTDFYEVHETTMNKREYIGDTEYSYEVVGFFPHFAIIDSTKEVVSLSDSLNNVAFKITVYNGEEVEGNAWSFFTIQVPHFSREAHLTFDVMEFEYQGQTYINPSKKADSEKEEI